MVAFFLFLVASCSDPSPYFEPDAGADSSADVDTDTDVDTDSDAGDAGVDTDTIYPLDELCGQVTDGEYCSASTSATCTAAAGELAAAYCAIGGHPAAFSFEEQTAGTWGPTWYYTSSGIPTDCSDLAWNTYGASELCPCVTDLVCQ